MKWRVEFMPHLGEWRAQCPFYPVCSDGNGRKGCPCRDFATHAEAIDYVDRMARR